MAKRKDIGLYSFFDVENFSAGIAKYVDGLSKAKIKTDTAAKSMSTVGAVAGGAATGGVATMAAAIGVANVVIGKLVTSIGDAIKSLGSFVQSTLESAASLDRMLIAMRYLSSGSAELASGAEKAWQQLKEMNFQADVAAKIVSQFVRFELPLEFVESFAVAARNIAAFSKEGSNLNDVIDTLIVSITSMTGLAIRRQGAPVNLELIYKKLADTLGVTTQELTIHQRQMAILMDIIEQAASMEGLYEETTKSAGVQIEILNTKFNDMKMALGAPFQDAIAQGAKLLTDIVLAITEAVSEGGRFYNFLMRIGAMASIFVEGLSKIVKAITGFGLEFSDGFLKTVADVATRAFEWGVNIAAQLADGLITGAGNAIVSAMNYIADLIASWLAPGSPPKVAPDLIKWGISAVTFFLKGFTMGDYDILKAIQRPLKDALSYFADIGRIGEGTEGQIFADISKALIESLSSGVLDESVLERLKNATGEFGEEIVQLARQQFELAKATDAVAAAEKALADARKRHADATKATNKLVREYNDMLRSGADQDALNAKLAEINASAEMRRAAAEEAKIAEESLDLAEQRVDSLQDQVKLQTELVNTLLELAKAMVRPVDVGADSGGGGGKGGGGGGPLKNLQDSIDTAMDNMKRSVTMAIDEIKEQVRQRLQDIFAPFRERVAEWSSMWAEIVGVASGLWNQFVTIFSTGVLVMGYLWDQYKAGFISTAPEVGEATTTLKDTIKTEFEHISEHIATNIGEIMKKSEEFATALEDLGVNLELFADIAFRLGEIMGEITSIAQNVGLAILLGTIHVVGLIVDNVVNAGIKLGGLVIEIATHIANLVTSLNNMEEGQTTWGLIWDAIVSIGTTSADTLEETIGDFIDGVQIRWEDLKNELVDNSIVPEMMTEIETIIEEALANSETSFDTHLSAASTTADTQFGSISDSASKMLDEVESEIASKTMAWKTRFETGFREIRRAIITAFGNITADIKSSLSGISTAINDALGSAAKNVNTGQFSAVGAAMADNIIGAIKAKKSAMAVALTEVVNNAFTAALNAASQQLTIPDPGGGGGGGSGPPAGTFPFSEPGPGKDDLAGIGFISSFMNTLGKGKLGNINTPISQLLTPSISPVPAVINNVTHNTVVNMGGQTISGGMSAATFEARVRRIIRSEMR